MNQSLRIWLLLTLVAAVLLSAFQILRLAEQGRELAGMERSLRDSRTAWETTAEAKETLQAERQALINAIKEAELTLEESKQRTETLSQEIETLLQSREELSNMLILLGIFPEEGG